MTITYPITFPTSLYVAGLKITALSAVSRSESPFSFAEKVYDWGGQMWAIEGALPRMTRDDAAQYEAFILKLNGRQGTFLFPVFETTPRGVATGTPVVNGAGQSGNVLSVSGFTPSTTGIMRAGDWLQIGTGATTRLYRVLDDANSDGAGDVDLTVWPRLRSSPSDGATVIVNNCKGLFRLVDAVPVDIDTNKTYGMSFQALEALNGA